MWCGSVAGDVTVDDFLGFVEGGVLGSWRGVQLVERAAGRLWFFFSAGMAWDRSWLACYSFVSVEGGDELVRTRVLSTKLLQKTSSINLAPAERDAALNSELIRW